MSIPADAGLLADRLAERLADGNYRVVRTHSPAEFDSYGRRLEIPSGFTDAVFAGHPMKVRFTRTGEGLDNTFDQVRIARAVYTLLADLPAIRSGATPAPRTFTLDVHSAGRRVEAPSGFEQSVPGIMVMFTLLVLFTSGAVTLTIGTPPGHPPTTGNFTYVTRRGSARKVGRADGHRRHPDCLRHAYRTGSSSMCIGGRTLPR